MIGNRFSNSIEADRRSAQARALLNTGIQLNCSEGTLTVSDEMLAGYGTATKLPLPAHRARGADRREQ